MIDVNQLKFDEKGLIPAIVVDAITKKVLTLAYMNKESLNITMEKGLTCFYSRSRNELWLKGETSGNYQHVVSITADCDNDALVIVVEKDGPACHKGDDSCFNYPVFESDNLHEFSYEGLIDLILPIFSKKVLIKFLKKLVKKARKLLLQQKIKIKKKPYMKLQTLHITLWCL